MKIYPQGFFENIKYNFSISLIMNKFAEDTKLGNIVNSTSDIETLQKCLEDFVSLAETWDMEFNVKKRKVMHINWTNLMAQYNMNGVVLMPTEEEQDIGVKVHKSLRPSKKCTQAACRTNFALSQITRAFNYPPPPFLKGLVEEGAGVCVICFWQRIA